MELGDAFALIGHVQGVTPDLIRALFEISVWAFQVAVKLLSWNGTSLLVALLALFFFFYAENVRRPVIEFLGDRDEVDPDSAKFFYHIWVRNASPRRLLNRDIAVACTAKVDFLDRDEFLRGREVRFEPPGQITTKWEAQPNPVFRDAELGTFFDPEKVAPAQRRDVGFSPEKLDVVVKLKGDPNIYATMYRSSKFAHLGYLRVRSSNCWWTLISDLRTVLEKHPLAVDEIKALLAETA